MVVLQPELHGVVEEPFAHGFPRLPLHLDVDEHHLRLAFERLHASHEIEVPPLSVRKAREELALEELGIIHAEPHRQRRRHEAEKVAEELLKQVLEELVVIRHPYSRNEQSMESRPIRELHFTGTENPARDLTRSRGDLVVLKQFMTETAVRDLETLFHDPGRPVMTVDGSHYSTAMVESAGCRIRRLNRSRRLEHRR